MSPSRSVEAPLSSGQYVSCQSVTVPLSISFSGSGFLATYQLGVAQSMLDRSPWVLQAAPKVMGASAGSLVAAAVVCGSSLDMVRDEMLRFVRQMRGHVLGPLHPEGNVSVWIERMLRLLLPADAHIRASGRLAIAMTRIPDGQNIMVSKFTSREDVVQALLCGCFLPGYCGIQPPSYKGVHYLDGGFSSIQPTNSCPIGHTITVSPFAGETDICPKDPAPLCDVVVSGANLHCSLVNGYRMLDAMYPYNWEALDKAYHSGYRDGLHFLQTSDLVPCLPLLNTPSEPHFSPPNGWTDLETDLEEEEKEEGKQKEEEEQIERRQMKRWEQEEYEDDEEEEEEEWVDEVNVWSSLAETRGSQRNCSLEGGDLPWHLSTLEQVMYLALPTWINTALLCNIMGLPWTHSLLRVMSHLLLPFTVLLSFLIENTHRMGVLGFWLWQDLRQITFYLMDILVSSLRRNLQDRVLPPLFLPMMTEVRAEYEGLGKTPQGQLCSTLRLHLSSLTSFSSPSPSSPPSPDSNQYTILLRLDLEQAGM
ncbi:patatin-like phospholipase domain-containing protein 2 isoform X1 [Salmo trutta]|uniref:patatin-like phospholipase domain-containing protein 2 isoform X1 n=1 Tax=Salmo trutta TaxID=8032 RepID=UPI001131BA56|nr:patatin-like phospholipase domain-containing protein 2 isoform X1 [Salmo trutta]